MECGISRVWRSRLGGVSNSYFVPTDIHPEHPIRSQAQQMNIKKDKNTSGIHYLKVNLIFDHV